MPQRIRVTRNVNIFHSIRVSEARAETVINEIRKGADPHFGFYLLLICSTFIACFGLNADSTAVIIGAMLVSPLMMPIFGVALGMLKGDPGLLGRSLFAEAGGAALAIAAAYLVGQFQLTAGEATHEMLIRTQPNLMDLLVAVFAGLAGSYAMVDERISPALPGVAIATAIVPPLATCGLCLSLGAYAGAGGALLLFLANIVSILLVSLTTFAATGLTAHSHSHSMRGLARRFGLTFAIFVVVSVILTNSLIHITRERRIRATIKSTLTTELESIQSASLERFIYDLQGERIQILATIRAYRPFQPARVGELQQALSNALEAPTDLAVRSLLANDVMPSGSSLSVTNRDMDRSFLTTVPVGEEAKEVVAEQVIREQFQNEPGFELTNLEFGQSARDDGIILAYVNTVRRLGQDEILSIETRLRERLRDHGLILLLRVNSPVLESSLGTVRAEWTSWEYATEAERKAMPSLKESIREIVAGTAQVLPTHIHFNIGPETWKILIEVIGPQPVTTESVSMIRDQLAGYFDKPIEVHIWYRSEFIVNPDGYSTYEQLTAPELPNRKDLLRELFQPEQQSTAPDISADAAASTDD